MSKNTKVSEVFDLTTTGNKGLGKGLIEEAQAANRETLKGQVVGKVQEFLIQIQKQRDYIASAEANVALLRRKLEAVEAGEFTLSVYGNFTFNDSALNKAVTSMTECVNCGYSARAAQGLDPVPGRNR